MSGTDWSKAAEFVPSWYVPKKEATAATATAAPAAAPPAATPAPAPQPKPKPQAKQQPQPQPAAKKQPHQPATTATAPAPAAGATSSDQSSGIRIAAAPSSGLNANAAAFIMPSASPVSAQKLPPPPQYQPSSVSSAAGASAPAPQTHAKKSAAGAVPPSAYPAHAASHQHGKQQHQPPAAGGEETQTKRQNPKPKKPPAPTSKQAAAAAAAAGSSSSNSASANAATTKAALPGMGSATASWVTPPMAPAPSPGSKNLGGSSKQQQQHDDHSLPPPLMDLGVSAAEQQKAVLDSVLSAKQMAQSDVERITAKSKLSSAAAVFMPAGFVPKTRPTVQPVSVPRSMPTVAPVVPEENRNDLSLLDTWCLYFDDAVKKSEDEFDPYLICHLSDVSTFWRVFQNVPAVSRQNDNTNYYMFREGVMPKWEDPRNDGGGAWTLKFQLTRSSDVIDATWERLCCQVVGENWSEEIRPTVMGVVAKIRPRSISFQIWVSKKINELLTQLQDRALAQTLAAAMWDYIPHPRPQIANPVSSSTGGSSTGSREGSVK